jgi:N-acetylglutamate synthase/N-acetylornithine aminotransferase
LDDLQEFEKAYQKHYKTETQTKFSVIEDEGETSKNDMEILLENRNGGE